MKIFINELKKIWDWRLLVVMTLMGGLFYYLFMSYSIDYYRMNHPRIEGHDLAVEMTERYGPTITQEELDAFVSEKRSALSTDIETYITTLPIFAEAGITSFAEYDAWRHHTEPFTGAEEEAYWALLDEKTDFIGFQLNALDDVEAFYYETGDTNEPRSTMSGYAFEQTMQYGIYLAILTILLSLVLVSPLVVNDRAKNIHFLQYTSKNGREILSQQFFAAVLSAAILTTFCIVLFGALFSQNGTAVFWHSPVESFLNRFIGELWFDVTYGAYILIAILFLYILNLSVVALAFVVSRFSSNIIAVVMKLIPVFAATTFLCFALFERMLSNRNQLYQLTGVIGIEGIVAIVLLGLVVAISSYTLTREKRTDVF